MAGRKSSDEQEKFHGHPVAGTSPNDPVVRILYFQWRGADSIPGWGTEIPHATWHKTLFSSEEGKINVQVLCRWSFSRGCL